MNLHPQSNIASYRASTCDLWTISCTGTNIDCWMPQIILGLAWVHLPTYSNNHPNDIINLDSFFNKVFVLNIRKGGFTTWRPEIDSGFRNSRLVRKNTQYCQFLPFTYMYTWNTYHHSYLCIYLFILCISYLCNMF